MSVKKYEPVIINRVVRGVDTVGDNTETLTVWFNTVALIDDIKNPLNLKEFYRQYSSFVNMTLQYTPNIYTIAQRNDEYAFVWRGLPWRIIDAVENARESIAFLCYDANQSVAV